MEDIMTLEEEAKYLKVKLQTIYIWAQNCRIPVTNLEKEIISVIRLGLGRFSTLPIYLRFPEGQSFRVSDLRYLNRHVDFYSLLHLYAVL